MNFFCLANVQEVIFSLGTFKYSCVSVEARREASQQVIHQDQGAHLLSNEVRYDGIS